MQNSPSEPSISRAKISHELAFPLGYELLKQLFGDLPQWPSFQIWFSDRPVYWASEFTKILKESKPYAIASVRYENWRLESEWHISFRVYPVKRELKSLARESFLASAPDEFRRFILAEFPDPRPHHFRNAVFDPLMHTCVIERQDHAG